MSSCTSLKCHMDSPLWASVECLVVLWPLVLWPLTRTWEGLLSLKPPVKPCG